MPLLPSFLPRSEGCGRVVPLARSATVTCGTFDRDEVARLQLVARVGKCTRGPVVPDTAVCLGAGEARKEHGIACGVQQPPSPTRDDVPLAMALSMDVAPGSRTLLDRGADVKRARITGSPSNTA